MRGRREGGVLDHVLGWLWSDPKCCKCLWSFSQRTKRSRKHFLLSKWHNCITLWSLFLCQFYFVLFGSAAHAFALSIATFQWFLSVETHCAKATQHTSATHDPPWLGLFLVLYLWEPLSAWCWSTRQWCHCLHCVQWMEWPHLAISNSWWES